VGEFDSLIFHIKKKKKGFSKKKKKDKKFYLKDINKIIIENGIIN